MRNGYEEGKFKGGIVMKANEIQIGDLVYSTFSKLPCKVMYLKLHESGYTSVETTNVVGVKDITSLSPIPLTPEILEKNGFTRKLDADDLHYRFTLIYEYTMFSLLYVRSVFLWLNPLDFKYVHQLQHALRLCGIEKEIVL